MVAGGSDARLLSSLNMELGQLFSDAVGRICDKAGVNSSWLGFVASRGQTVWHEPDASRVYADGKRYHASTLQLGEPALIAYDHNVRVVANFRAMDMAAGGQGAPLVPFSEVVLYGADDCNRVLLNISGIGNVTVLPAGRRAADVFAFDTGPGNITVMVALPLLIAAALAGTRYVVDTDRGLCRGALITFAVAWAASLLVCWLVLYQGVMPF